MLTSQTEPVSASHSITVSYGYDLDGNRTALTDGNGNTTYTTYNSLGLPAIITEPPDRRPQHHRRLHHHRQSTTATANLVTQNLPGGVQITNSYDAMGDLTGQSGTGAGRADRDPDLHLRRRRTAADRRDRRRRNLGHASATSPPRSESFG